MNKPSTRRVPPLRVCKSQKLGKDKWRAKYQDGIRPSPHTKEFATKGAADEWAGEQVAAIKTGNHVTAENGRKTLGSWCEEWLDLQTCNLNSKNTYRCTLRVILAYFGDNRPVCDIRERHVKAFLISLEGRYSFTSRIYINKILGRVLGEAHRNGLTAKCPWTAPRVTPDADYDYDEEEHADEDEDTRFYPSTEQVWQVYDTVAEPYRLAVLLGAFVGLRISETAGARIEDLWDEDSDGQPVSTFHPKRQWIRPGARPAPDKVYGPLKTKASRKTVPVPAPIVEMITQLLDGRTSGPIVIRKDGQPVTPHDINTALIDAVDAIGGDVARLRFHGFRHYLASTAFANGEDIATVCDRMRHKNPTVTLKTYTHLVKAAERRATDAIGAEAMRGRRAATAARWAERGLALAVGQKS